MPPKVLTPEEQIAELEKDKAAQLEKQAKLQEAFDKLKAAFDLLKSDADKATGELQNKIKALNDLQALYDALKTESEAFEKEATEQMAEISAELAKAKVIADKAEPTITVDKVDYKVIGQKFTYNKKEYTVEDLLANKALQKELVGKQMGFLVPKTASE